jgi:hypothetical protein
MHPGPISLDSRLSVLVQLSDDERATFIAAHNHCLAALGHPGLLSLEERMAVWELIDSARTRKAY